MWLPYLACVLSPSSTGCTFLAVVLDLPFSKRLHLPDEGKANSETSFIFPSHPFPISAFVGSTDWGSGFPVAHLGIRGVFLEMGYQRGGLSPFEALHSVSCTVTFLGNENHKNTCCFSTPAVSAPCPRLSLRSNSVGPTDLYCAPEEGGSESIRSSDRQPGILLRFFFPGLGVTSCVLLPVPVNMSNNAGGTNRLFLN